MLRALWTLAWRNQRLQDPCCQTPAIAGTVLHPPLPALLPKVKKANCLASLSPCEMLWRWLTIRCIAWHEHKCDISLLVMLLSRILQCCCMTIVARIGYLRYSNPDFHQGWISREGFVQKVSPPFGQVFLFVADVDKLGLAWQHIFQWYRVWLGDSGEISHSSLGKQIN